MSIPSSVSLSAQARSECAGPLVPKKQLRCQESSRSATAGLMMRRLPLMKGVVHSSQVWPAVTTVSMLQARARGRAGREVVVRVVGNPAAPWRCARRGGQVLPRGSGGRKRDTHAYGGSAGGAAMAL